MIKYSVIICTYNRFQLLEETIDSVLSVLKNREDTEILIIDNNSPDATATLKDKYSTHKFVKYILETKQGLSHARNRGMHEAIGDILVYLDDDIELVANYFEICDQIFSDPSVVISGGKVLPYKVEIPNWLPEKYYFLVSVFDCGTTPKCVKHLMGCNFVIRKKDALVIGLFNTKLGRNGSSLAGGEETEYQDRASALGYRIYYNPTLNIFHKINDKLNEHYVLTYSKEVGKSERIIDESISKTIVFQKTLKSYIAIILCFLFEGIVRDKKKKIFLKIINQFAMGYLSINKYKRSRN